MKSYIVQAIVALFALAALFVCGGQALGASAGELIGKPFPAGTTSSSSGGPGAPSYTYDNNLATSWSTYLTLGSGDWLRINLPAPQYIAGYQFVTSSPEGAGNQIINAYYTTNDNIQIGTKTIAADSNDSSSIISVSPGTYTKLMFGFYGTVHTTVKEIRIIPLPTPTVTAVPGDSQAQLSWNPITVGDVAGYHIYQGDTLIGTVSSSTYSYTATSLQNDVPYTFSVAAFDSGNAESLKAAVSVDLAPSAPTGVTAIAGESSAMLSWNPNPESDISGYNISLHVQGSQDQPQSVSVTASTYTYTVTGLTNGTAYEFTVAAIDAAGHESLQSTVQTATPLDKTAPSAPLGFTATAGDGEVTLNWVANTESDFAKYKVYWKAQNSSDQPQSADVDGGTSYIITSLTNGTAYEFTVAAVDTSGNESSPGSSLVATPRDSVAPSVPTGVTATAGDGQVTLNWTANTENDVAKYKVTWKVQNSSDPVQSADVITGTSYTLTGLTNGTAYEFTVIAVDTSGNESSPGSSLVATPPLSMPTGLTATAGNGYVELKWTASTENVDHYKIYWHVPNGQTSIATVSASTYAVTGLANGTAYTFTVVAVDPANHESPPSLSLTATPIDTAPSAPKGFTATAGDGEVTLNWNPNPESDIANYKVYWFTQDTADSPNIVSVDNSTYSYTVTGITYGTTYTFTLAAIDAAGNESPKSAPQIVTPQQQFLQVLLNSSMLSIGQNMELQIKFRIADGSLVDVSESAAVSITASSDTAQPIVEIAHNPLSLIPKAAGYVTLTVQYEGYTVEVPIFVNYREWLASKVNPTGGPASMHNVVSYLSDGNNDVTGDGIFDKTDVRALLELIEPVFVHAASD